MKPYLPKHDPDSNPSLPFVFSFLCLTSYYFNHPPSLVFFSFLLFPASSIYRFLCFILTSAYSSFNCFHPSSFPREDRFPVFVFLWLLSLIFFLIFL